jgi:regulatory protein
VAGTGDAVRITAIRAVGQGRKRVLALSDGRELIADAETCRRLGIRAGDDWTSDDVLTKLQTKTSEAGTHDAALRLLGSRARSESDMRRRLVARGASAEEVDSELERLRSAGLVDDERFAQAWVEERQRRTPRGRRMLQHELRSKGIAAESVELATQGVDDRAAALALARGKARAAGGADYAAFLAKVGGHLRRRGFDYEVTREAVKVAWREATGGAPEGEAGDE